MPTRRRLLASAVAALTVWVGVLISPALADNASSAPQVKYAIAVDRNGNDHVDGLRLVFDQMVRHPADVDGSYPFSVDGYRVTGVQEAHGRHLIVTVAERTGAPDVDARPAVTYTPTSAQPVTGAGGVQAAAQEVTAIVSLDSDGDGFTAADGDCNDADPTVHPGAADVPDLAQMDSNCDGIDGTAADAIFVAPTGDDANAGTMAAPKRSIEAAIASAASYAPPRDVYVYAGTYDEPSGLTLRSGVGVYGGYVGDTWEVRGGSTATVVTGAPQAALADGATSVVVQLLTLRGQRDENAGADPSVYGLRAINGAQVRLENVRVTSAEAGPGADGAIGTDGVSAPVSSDIDAGAPGVIAPCGAGAIGGRGLTGPGYRGGTGGTGGTCTAPAGSPGGTGGGPSSAMAPGGAGGLSDALLNTVAAGDGAGRAGFPGAAGVQGKAGDAGDEGFEAAGPGWSATAAGTGGAGTPGGGGGGGGGGASWACACSPAVYPGGGGGGGGAGGGGGTGGSGGQSGGGSFALYLWNAGVSVSNSTLIAGDGGPGGAGGTGGEGGEGSGGGPGGTGVAFGFGVGGAGGAGGTGGAGGPGGGGAGGPSVGLFRGGTSTVSVDAGTLILYGVGGAGGRSPAGVLWNGPTGRTGTILP